MDSTVKTRPNHYELLGLAPTASNEEVAQAFAREVSRPREFGGLAAVGIAYETLRNAKKRRAYDAAIGLVTEPGPTLKKAPKPYAMHAIVATPHLRTELTTEPRTEAFISPSPLEPELAFRPERDPTLRPEPAVRPEPGAYPRSELLRRLEAVAMPTFQPTAGPDRPLPSLDVESALEGEDPPIAWKRPFAIGGVVVVAVAVIGAIVGLNAGSDAQTAQSESAVTSTVPMVRPRLAPATPSPLPAVAALDVQPDRRASSAARPRRIERAPVQRQATGLADTQLDAKPAEPVGAAPVEPTSLEAPSVPVVSAGMPLPNATIARTIGRIGYACGQVSSTSAIEGEGPDVFKVTCTSGHSYKAAPVRGRYHFRRLGNQ